MNRILIFGDSITWGAVDTEGGWAFRLKKYTDNQAIDSDEYDTIYPLGISGDNTEKFLLRFETELKCRIDDDTNMVVVIALGINDSQFALSNKENRVPLNTFKNNYKKVLHILSQYNVKDIVLVGLTPVDDDLLNPMPWKPTHGYNNQNVQKYDAVLKQIAQDNKLLYIELYKKFADHNNYKELLSDGLHPNTEGHRFIYKTVLNELKSFNLLK